MSRVERYAAEKFGMNYVTIIAIFKLIRSNVYCEWIKLTTLKHIASDRP